MVRTKLIDIAKETIKITEQGYYFKNGKKIDLIKNTTNHGFDNVRVLSPQKLTSIENDEDEFFERSFYGTEGAKFYLVDADSYEAAFEFDNPLVMNFANAINPGGGFLNGAKAQEECLCRNSTLYASISSKEAMEMYEYNRNNINAIDSDYMLLSPDVCVFRNVQHELLDEPYCVSVITTPAPNKNGRAWGLEQEKLDNVMKNRLRKMLYAAARYGYSNLVLGAWGCGAFGHDTSKVAEYFYELFFDEGFNEFFESVTFAILYDKDKINVFDQVFREKIENNISSR